MGRPPVLTEGHGFFLIRWADENTNSVVLEVLSTEFGKLEIKKNKAFITLRKV